MRRNARIRARHALARRAGAAAPGVYALVPGCLFSRRWTARTRRRIAASLPTPLVEIKNAAGLDGKLGIARKDPAAMLPRADRVRIEPAPDGAIADGRGQPRLPRLLRHVGHAETRERQAQCAGSSHARALTTTSGGKSPGSTRASLILQAREALLEKALAPQAHDFAPRMEARRDLVVAQVFGGEEDHLGSVLLSVSRGNSGIAAGSRRSTSGSTRSPPASRPSSCRRRERRRPVSILAP